MKVICISGKAGSGKDTTANMLSEILTASGNSVLITHYADLVKYFCRSFFGWNGEKDVYGRSLLQHVGTDVVRAYDKDYWVGFIAEVLTMFPEEWDFVLIPDCRFPNEIDYLRERDFDVTHVMVVRSGEYSTLTEEQKAHSSETALDNTLPDIYINNHGTIEDLRKTIEGVVYDMNGYYQMSLIGVDGK